MNEDMKITTRYARIKYRYTRGTNQGMKSKSGKKAGENGSSASLSGDS